MSAVYIYEVTGPAFIGNGVQRVGNLLVPTRCKPLKQVQNDSEESIDIGWT